MGPYQVSKNIHGLFSSRILTLASKRKHEVGVLEKAERSYQMTQKKKNQK